MPILSRKDLERISRRVLFRYLTLSDRKMDRIDPVDFAEKICGLHFAFADMSITGSILGLTSYSDVDLTISVPRGNAYGHFDGKGQATMSWFIHRFKPLIDQNFRTLPDRAHTFIGGSSMGGLMSLYALLQYNDTYSRAAALSPSIWVAPDKLSGLVGRAKLAPGTVLYMDYGSREMGNHDGIRRQFSALSGKLMTRGIHLTSRIVPGGTHCEASWEKQLPFVFHTLLYEVEE